MILPIEITKYLKKFSLGDWKLVGDIAELYEAVVVIPALAEYENLKRLIKSLGANNESSLSKTLFVFVVNNRACDSEEVKSDNIKSIKFLRESESGKLNVGIIDASTRGNELPEKEGGVGLARKIGMDLALNYFDYSSKRKKILVCLDADCTVENNYLSEIISQYNKNKLSAAYVNFEHPVEGTDEEKRAIICYEIFLRYYVLGLKLANSPYAFHTIGSTISCDSESYVKVQGMNKRKAAEDFYFIEKLAKVTNVTKIETTKIFPSGRKSWRVPFGTGQRVNRFLSRERNEYLLYSPESFIILKKWNLLFLNDEIWSPEKYLLEAGYISLHLKTFLEKQTFAKDWENILQNSKSVSHIVKQKKLWFDGFKTLKLIHHLRDSQFPDVNMFDALDEIFKMTNIKNDIPRSEEIPSIEIQMEYLKILRANDL